VVQIFVETLYFPENRVERVLEGAVDRIPLCGAELLDVGADALAGLLAAGTVALPKVSDDFVAGQHGLADLIVHGFSRNIAR
jgi:hypothetical protein